TRCDLINDPVSSTSLSPNRSKNNVRASLPVILKNVTANRRTISCIGEYTERNSESGFLITGRPLARMIADPDRVGPRSYPRVSPENYQCDFADSPHVRMQRGHRAIAKTSL